MRAKRRTQQERSESTRVALLDATIDCLIERGYGGTTTVEVAARAGVSRGAQVHHFPSKADLVTNAIAHLATRRGKELRREAARRCQDPIQPADRVSVAIDLLWSAYSGPTMMAAIELWVAARSDPDLFAKLHPLERRFGRALFELCHELFGPKIGGSPGFADAINLTLHMMRGMALWGVPQLHVERSDRSIRAWKKAIAPLLEGPI